MRSLRRSGYFSAGGEGSCTVIDDAVEGVGGSDGVGHFTFTGGGLLRLLLPVTEPAVEPETTF